MNVIHSTVIDTKQLRIYLDGVEVEAKNVATANSEAGFVEVIIRDVDGRPIIDREKSEIVTEIKHGEVRFGIKAES